MVCSETLRFSLDGRDELSLPSHLRHLVDCGEILQTTQNAMLRGSELSLMLAAVCMEACEKLASSCRTMNGADPQLAACVEACEETAEACRALSA